MGTLIFAVLNLIYYTLSNIIFKIEVIHSNNNIIKLVTKELEDNGIKKYKFVKNYQEIEKNKCKHFFEKKNAIYWKNKKIYRYKNWQQEYSLI